MFSELNQGLIISKGGGQLLANMASKTDDPQTLRMVAGVQLLIYVEMVSLKYFNSYFFHLT